MAGSTTDGGSTTRFRKGRRPHNANLGQDFGSVGELVRSLGSEKKLVRIEGEDVEMTWAERSLRLTIERALTGNRRDLAHLLRLMMKHPAIGGTYRERQVCFIRGVLCRA